MLRVSDVVVAVTGLSPVIDLDLSSEIHRRVRPAGTGDGVQRLCVAGWIVNSSRESARRGR